MSTITREFTKEQLQQIIETDHVQCGEASSLARIALASLEAVPVGEVSEQRDGLVMDGMVDLGGASTHRIIKGASKMKRLPLGTKFYTAPPAPVALTSGYSDFEEIWSSSTHPLTQDDEMKDFAWDIWNACRAAMLQSFGNSEQLNSPVIPDGWVLVPEEPTHEMLEAGDEQFGTYDVYRRMIEAAPKLE